MALSIELLSFHRGSVLGHWSPDVFRHAIPLVGAGWHSFVSSWRAVVSSPTALSFIKAELIMKVFHIGVDRGRGEGIILQTPFNFIEFAIQLELTRG
jgi:hypothetical protein